MKPCPKCRAKGTVITEKNLLGIKIKVLRCTKCGSVSTSQDNGIHWGIMVNGNGDNKEADKETTQPPD